MASRWREVTLGDVCNLRAGSVFPPALQGRSAGDYPFAKVSDMNLPGNSICIRGANHWVDEADVETLKIKPFPPGTTVFAKIGEALKANRLRFLVRPTLIDNNMMGATPVEDVVEPRFFYYALSQFDFGEVAGGTALPYLTVGALSKLELRLPPLAIQQAIAHILGTLDDKIELNRQTNETLEAMARALFKSWFVDFDPVRAKAEGRQPSGMDAETAKLFPSEFEESELGEIPKGWACAPLEHWATALSGGTPSKSNPSLWNGDLPWISPKVMTSIHADEADAFVTGQAVGNGTRIAPAGSTLIMVRGMGLHQEVRVSQVRREVTFNQDVKALVPRQIEASLLLFAMLDAQEVLLGRVESSGHGTGKLPSEILLNHPIVMPPVEVQRKLAGIFTNINDRIASARAEIRHLAALRDTLLPALLSGELPVGGAERVLEAQA